MACSQETWFLGFVLGSLFWVLLFSDVNQLRAKQTEGSPPRSLETDPEMQNLTLFLTPGRAHGMLGSCCSDIVNIVVFHPFWWEPLENHRLGRF